MSPADPSSTTGCSSSGDARNTVLAPPPGVEANNAVALRRRREQDHEQRQRADVTPSEPVSATLTQLDAASAANTSAPGATAARLLEIAVAAGGSGLDAPAAGAGSVLGAVFLITGSTVGAGILALPVVAGPAGFGPSTGSQCRTGQASALKL